MKKKQHSSYEYVYTCTVHSDASACRMLKLNKETGMHSPVHVELSRFKEYPAMHPHLKEPTVLKQVWEQLLLPI